MAARNIVFDGNSLQTDHIFTQDIDDASIPKKNDKMYALGHADRSAIPFISYSDKKITVAGTIIGDTVADLDSRIDAFKYFFNNQDKNLDIDYAGSTRRYIATANMVEIKRPGGLLHANFTIDFQCTQPFGQDVNATTALSFTGRTANAYTDAYTFLGTAPSQLMVATFTLTAVSATGAQSIVFGNNNNGQQITVTRTWAVNDVLIIDVTQRTVTVNSIAVDYSGAFPEFKPGSQSLGYSDTLTSRTFNMTVTYNVMYM